MVIKGVRNSSVPDLRLTLPVATISSIGRSSSVVVIGVVEVNISLYALRLKNIQGTLAGLTSYIS